MVPRCISEFLKFLGCHIENSRLEQALSCVSSFERSASKVLVRASKFLNEFFVLERKDEVEVVGVLREEHL